MTQLTKEHLDKALDKHFKKVDQRFQKMDRSLAQVDHRFETIEGKMATKDDVAKLATKQDLKAEINQLAGMVQRRFDDVERKLDVRVRVENNERDIRVIKQALHLTK